VYLGVIIEKPNTTGQPENQYQSIYALLIRSEEKSRNAFEALIYPLLILGPLIAIWQFAQQPVNIPAAGLKGVSCAVVEDWARNTVRGDESHTLLRNRATKIKA
jgi:hypothetical protein